MDVGIAWYTPETYEQLLAVIDDREAMPDTFDEWHTKALQALRTLRAKGTDIEQIFIDVGALVEWCRSKRVPITGSNRAQYVSELTGRKKQQPPPLW